MSLQTSAGISHHKQILMAEGNYKLPWQGCDKFPVAQGNSQGPTHWPNTPMEFAIDFDLPEGTPVVAARGGIVVHVHDGETECGGFEYRNKANRVVIDHGDGTSALYLHLKSVLVSVSDEVKQGQPIGLSGKTGWTSTTADNCDPHLHFQLQTTDDIWFSQSIPITFSDEPDAKLKRGEILHSGNFDRVKDCPIEDESFCDFVRELEPLIINSDIEAILARADLRDCIEEGAGWYDFNGVRDCPPDIYCLHRGIIFGEGGCTPLRIIHEDWEKYADEPLRIRGLVYPGISHIKLPDPLTGPGILIDTTDEHFNFILFSKKIDDRWLITASVFQGKGDIESTPPEIIIPWP